MSHKVIRKNQRKYAYLISDGDGNTMNFCLRCKHFFKYAIWFNPDSCILRCFSALACHVHFTALEKLEKELKQSLHFTA